MSAPDLTATLLACQNADPSVRQSAESALQSAEEHNLSEFLIALATELGTEGQNEASRQLAGLHLKNLLVAKDDALQVERHDRWKALPSEVRNVVKGTALAAIVCSTIVWAGGWEPRRDDSHNRPRRSSSSRPTS